MSHPTVVLIPSWGSGHFMSALEAGKRLLAAGGGAFSLTVLVMRPPSQAKASEVEDHVRRESASGLDIRFLQLPAVEPITDWVAPCELVSRHAQLHAPHVKAAISTGLAPTSRVAAVVFDLFFTTLFDVVHELGVPAYVYFSSPAAFLSLMLRLPELRQDLTGVGFAEMEDTVDVPGLSPVPPSFMPSCLVKDKHQSYDWFEYHGRRFRESRGIIINTTVDLEAPVLAAIASPALQLHAIGPVIWFGPCDDQQHPRHQCMLWLDAQPAASVVFICFGSLGTLHATQVREVATALERSGHRFLWVLRGPPAAGTRQPTNADLDELLPAGFLEATRGRGLVWPAWAPQQAVLSHDAVGGFVTHCGWNSVLESLWSGVPMLPWPLYGEQQLNAFELVAGMGVAVALEMDRKKGFFVEAAELERALRNLMDVGSEEGTKARVKAKEASASCRKAVTEGGSSSAALQSLVREILALPNGQ